MPPSPTALRAGSHAPHLVGLKPVAAQAAQAAQAAIAALAALAALASLVALPLLGAGCSIRSYATGALADTFAGSGTGYASDDDPELVAAAVPFALKTMEQVAAEQPRHVGLATALASGFAAFAYAFVEQEADVTEDKDVARAKPLRLRARKLELRARDHALRGLEIGHPGITAAMMAEGRGTESRRGELLAAMRPGDVPLLYWAAASWALAIGSSKAEMRLVGQLGLVEALMSRAAALDPDFDEGSIHEFYVSYEGGRDGGAKAARDHLDRALALSKATKLGVLVSFAEAVDVTSQNRAEFQSLLGRVLAFDVDSAPAHRLANVVAQRRARWLLSRIEELFAE